MTRSFSRALYMRIRRALSKWLDPDVAYTTGIRDCLEYGMPRLVERYGESSLEVQEARDLMEYFK